MENLNTKKVNNDPDKQFKDKIEVISSLNLEKKEQFFAFIQKLQESQIHIEPEEEREMILNKIKEILYNQTFTQEKYFFVDFVNHYRAYMTDIYLKLKNNDYESDLINRENLSYVFGLYTEYANTLFNEFVKELGIITKDVWKLQKPLLPYLEFERWLFYHAFSLCPVEMEMPDYIVVNDIIRSKPYGNSHYYPQIKSWQITDQVGKMKGWRDFYCELAIKKRQS